jgi:hypothetical protein
MRWSDSNNSVGLPDKFRRRVTTRPSLFSVAARAIDKKVTRVQEWLEADDRAAEMVIAYGTISLFALVLGCALFKMLGGFS